MKYSESNEDIWKFHKAGEWIVITTNGFVKKNGELVMGRGTAKQAMTRYPGIAYALGQKRLTEGNICFVNQSLKIITFPVKKAWMDKADVTLIRDSFVQLIKLLDKLKIQKIYVPKPGCGNGGLNWKIDVEPIVIAHADDNRITFCDINSTD